MFFVVVVVLLNIVLVFSVLCEQKTNIFSMSGMEDSSSSSSYSFSDTSIDNENNSVCTCTLTKITYNSESFTTANTLPQLVPDRPPKHINLERSKSEPAIRLTDREEDNTGLEPNCDLFGIQLEV